MRYTDHHMHTEFSGDCEAPLHEMVQSALNKGQEVVMLTDHVDYDFPDLKAYFEVDFDSYNRAIHKAQAQSHIQILKGVEIGWQPHLVDRINALIQKERFDFIINSIHVCDGKDFMNGDFFIGKTQKQSYQRYFETMLESVECFEQYDVIGHMDFIMRYGPFREKKLFYEDYKVIIDKILDVLIQKEKGIELNTSGIRYNLKTFHPQEAILKSYFDKGGRVITVGSDAHLPKDVQADFAEAFKLLSRIGFTEVSCFKARNMSMMHIDTILKAEIWE